jgi:hypothetical protein
MKQALRLKIRRLLTASSPQPGQNPQAKQRYSYNGQRQWR